MNKPSQKAKSTAASPSVTQKPAAKPSGDNSATAATVKLMPVKTTPVKTDDANVADAPMHAAKGNDDIMSQPQASRIGKKKS